MHSGNLGPALPNPPTGCSRRNRAAQRYEHDESAGSLRGFPVRAVWGRFILRCTSTEWPARAATSGARTPELSHWETPAWRLAKGKLDGAGDVGRQHGLGLLPEPVARMRPVGGDHECRPPGVCLIDPERARRPGQCLKAGRPTSQSPPVGRAVHDDAACSPYGPVPWRLLNGRDAIESGSIARLDFHLIQHGSRMFREVRKPSASEWPAPWSYGSEGCEGGGCGAIRRPRTQWSGDPYPATPLGRRVPRENIEPAHLCHGS